MSLREWLNSKPHIEPISKTCQESEETVDTFFVVSATLNV